MNQIISPNKTKIGFISLGCPKAGSDTEKVLSQVRSEGYDIANNYKDAALVIVNTCGFIDSAIDESLDAINEALRENGNVIVMGCLGEKKHLEYLWIPGYLFGFYCFVVSTYALYR